MKASSTRITIEDIRRSGHCVRGAKAWFDSHGLDFRDFLKNGMEIEKVAAMGDGYADQIIVRKLVREPNRGG